MRYAHIPNNNNKLYTYQNQNIFQVLDWTYNHEWFSYLFSLIAYFGIGNQSTLSLFHPIIVDSLEKVGKSLSWMKKKK